MLKSWLQAEKKEFKGWDFSHINLHTQSEKLPWSYENMARSFVKDHTCLLDMGTGGGEFLLSLDPIPGLTYATEMYDVNFEYAKENLKVYGVDLRFVEDEKHLPFPDNFFDVVLNRHESFDPKEVYRILKPGGYFLTQQVGDQNSSNLNEWLLNCKIGQYAWSLNVIQEQLKRHHFKLLESDECFSDMKFLKMEAFIEFAKIIEWEFPNFSVEKTYDKLLLLQEQIQNHGYFTLKEHRFYVLAQK